MEFCPKCGSVLIQKETRKGCTRCGYSSKGVSKIKTTEKIEAKREIAVVNQKEAEVLPIVDIECKKCGSPKAYFWTMQTRSSDEAETKFYKCVKCAHTWREYR